MRVKTMEKETKKHTQTITVCTAHTNDHLDSRAPPQKSKN